MLVRVRSGTLLGVSAVPVDVEVDIAGGFPRFDLVGLAGNDETGRAGTGCGEGPSGLTASAHRGHWSAACRRQPR